MFRQYLNACAVVLVVFPLSTLAQDRNIYDACAIPREWQPALTQRLKSLVEYQRTGEWQRVSDMFGPFFDQQNRTTYTHMQRESLIANIRARPMIAFTPTDVTWSTAAFAYPLHKRWWYISGRGDFLTGSTAKSHPAEIIAPLLRQRHEQIVGHEARPLVSHEVPMNQNYGCSAAAPTQPGG